MIGHFPSLFTKYLVLEWHSVLKMMIKFCLDF